VDLENTYAPGGVSFNLVSGERRPYREETGVRATLTWQWENDKGFATHELWYLGVDDKQAPLFARRDNPFDVGVINIPRAREWGLRLSGEQALADEWSATWQWEWRDTRFTEAPSDLAGIEGHRWLYVPRLDATLGLRRYLGDSWRMGLEVRRQSGQFTDVQNNAQNELPAWTMVNANLQYMNDHWLVTLWGANLTDEAIFSYRSPADNFGVLTLGKTLGLRVEWQQ
jgi:outer membrane receptor protein involved in Fe transport